MAKRLEATIESLKPIIRFQVEKPFSTSTIPATAIAKPPTAAASRANSSVRRRGSDAVHTAGEIFAKIPNIEASKV